MDGFSGNFQDMQDRAISVISKSFTYYWVMYHMMNQIYSFLNSWVIVTKMDKRIYL